MVRSIAATLLRLFYPQAADIEDQSLSTAMPIPTFTTLQAVTKSFYQYLHYDNAPDAPVLYSIFTTNPDGHDGQSDVTATNLYAFRPPVTVAQRQG